MREVQLLARPFFTTWSTCIYNGAIACTAGIAFALAWNTRGFIAINLFKESVDIALLPTSELETHFHRRSPPSISSIISCTRTTILNHTSTPLSPTSSHHGAATSPLNSLGILHTFSRNSVSAPAHTGASPRSGNCSRKGSRSLLKASLASRGSSEGRWSMVMYESGGEAKPSSGMVGASK